MQDFIDDFEAGLLDFYQLFFWLNTFVMIVVGISSLLFGIAAIPAMVGLTLLAAIILAVGSRNS